MGLIPLSTSLPTPNGWVITYAVLRWERLQNYLKGVSCTKNAKHVLKIASSILSKMQSQPEAEGGLMNMVSSREIRTNVLSLFFHLCLPLDFILDTWGTLRSSRSPAQEWDALGCVSHHVLVLSDTTSSQQISAVQLHHCPSALIANSLPVGIPPFPQHTCTLSWGASRHSKPAPAPGLTYF